MRFFWRNLYDSLYFHTLAPIPRASQSNFLNSNYMMS